MKEIDAILLGTIFTVGIGFAAGILYFCKSNICAKTNENNVDEINVTYNEIYRRMEES